MKKRKFNFQKPKQKFFGAMISSTKSRMPGITIKKRNTSWPIIQKPKFDSENFISVGNLNGLISCAKVSRFQTYIREYNEINNDTISDFYWQRLSWFKQEFEHNLILLTTKKESDEFIKDYFQNIRKLVLDNKRLIDKVSLDKQFEENTFLATERGITKDLLLLFTQKQQSVFENIEFIIAKKEKELFAFKLLNSKDREEKHKAELTLAERLTIIIYLNDAGVFFNKSFSKSQFRHLISTLLNQDISTIKSTMDKSNKMIIKKIEDFTPQENEAALNSLKKIKPILEKLENTKITDEISKRIRALQLNSTFS